MPAEQPSPKNRPEATEAPAAPAQPPKAKASWRRFLFAKWIAIVVVASIVIHALGFLYYQVRGKTPLAPAVAEIPLGAFRYAGGGMEAGRIAAADFSLHITMLDRLDRAAREALEAHRFRVQQDVEQLLRQAHGGDFEDPTLGELKRQLREQINESLGMRAIAEVIVTDLKVKFGDRQSRPVVNTADTTPWVEKPSG